MFKRLIASASQQFVVRFLILFVAFYYFNLFFIGITGEGGLFYSKWLSVNLNYIAWLREFLLHASALVLKCLGYDTIIFPYRLKLVGGVSVGLVYSCLAYGILSFFSAFVIAYPKPIKSKIYMLIIGFILINLINVLRIVSVLLVYSYYSTRGGISIDHHLIFNIIAYLFIALMIWIWLNLNTKFRN